MFAEYPEHNTTVCKFVKEFLSRAGSITQATAMNSKSPSKRAVSI